MFAELREAPDVWARVAGCGQVPEEAESESAAAAGEAAETKQQVQGTVAGVLYLTNKYGKIVMLKLLFCIKV